MNAGFLNFHGEEHFSTLESFYFLEQGLTDDVDSYDEHKYAWNWDHETELNGDIGLIPASGNTSDDYCIMSTSPPSKEDFHKIMMEWQQLVNIETENVEELAIDVITSNALETAHPQDIIDNAQEKENIFSTNNMNLCDTSSLNDLTPEQLMPSLEIKPDVTLDNATIGTVEETNLGELCNSMEEDPIGHLANSDFDITKYVNETDKYCRNPDAILPSGPGPGGKRLDLKNQRYVVDDDSDEDHIDVETVSEPAKSMGMDTDLSSDDEDVKVQMVAPQDILDIQQNNNHMIQDGFHLSELKKENVEVLENDYDSSDDVDLEVPNDLMEAGMIKVETTNVNVKVEPDVEVQKVEDMKTEISPVIEAGDLNSLLEQFEASETSNKIKKPCVATDESAPAKDQIDDNRKDQAKSKQILESLPEELINRIKQSSKRKSISVIPPIPNKKRGKPLIPTGACIVNTSQTSNSCETVIQMDHDYCISSNSSKKDSGFSSCEEDERSLLRNQPTVKMADGKLMVSLLKVNTIKKRKLNLEEYKQRRQGRSCSGSPARIEDENARRLQRMNIQPCPPPNMEVKTLVSIAVNTDQSWGRLQEIVRGCPVNFSPNSLITSLVEHLPQVKEVSVPGEHGEDKTIVYLDKNRAMVKTANKKTQTVVHRRRSSSSSSSSSRSSRSRTRSPSPTVRRRRTSAEKLREVEERRVIYVGRIANSVTRECLRKRFQRFGPINNVSVHFRRTGDNYGFVTFKYKEDAYAAVEYGNEDPNLPQYDLSFGGRRIFCQTSYADLDNLREDCPYPPALPVKNVSHEDSFEDLLRETQAKLLRNKRLNGKS
ncbi:hypothetical protein Trydic_g18091 [Trypoxylus dichotomus]